MHDPLFFESSSEPILDSSIGVSNILNSLAILSQMKPKPIWDTVLINVMTLIRNNLDKDKTDAKIIENVKIDISMLITYFSEYFSMDTPDSPYIIFYLPTYSKIPLLHKRKLNATTSRIEDILKKLEKEVNGDIEELDQKTFKIYTVKVGRLHFPHVQLKNHIDKFNFGKQRIMNRRYVLISHCPLDYHITRYIKNTQIFESYTGKIKNIEQIGKRLFDSSAIPFNKYTHILFGDKVNLYPIVKRKDKQRMLESAIRMQWIRKTESMILNDIKSLNIIPVDMLTSIPL